MSSLPPLVSLPERASVPAPVARPRRLVKPLPRVKNLEAERARRAASTRARTRRQQSRLLTLAACSPFAALALWFGVRAIVNQSPWPSGTSWAMGVTCGQSPVALGRNWFFASNAGSVWRVGEGQSEPSKIWTGAFPASPRLTGSPHAVFVTGRDGTLLRLNNNGQKQWRVKNPAAISSRPAFFQNAEGSTLIGGDDMGHLWARDAQSGKSLWRRAIGAPVGDGATATPWGVVLPLLGSATTRGGLRCFSPSDGKEQWRFPSDPRIRAAGTALVRYDAPSQRLFWCNDEGGVFALDARTGRKIWKTYVAPRSGSKNSVVLRSSPVLANGVLVVGGSDGGLRAFDARTGRPLWTSWLGQSLAAPLGKVRVDNRALVVAGTSPVVLVDTDKGDIVRSWGSGQVAWNEGQFAASDEGGVWHRWMAD